MYAEEGTTMRELWADTLAAVIEMRDYLFLRPRLALWAASEMS